MLKHVIVDGQDLLPLRVLILNWRKYLHNRTHTHTNPHTFPRKRSVCVGVRWNRRPTMRIQKSSPGRKDTGESRKNAKALECDELCVWRGLRRGRRNKFWDEQQQQQHQQVTKQQWKREAGESNSMNFLKLPHSSGLRNQLFARIVKLAEVYYFFGDCVFFRSVCVLSFILCLFSSRNEPCGRTKVGVRETPKRE